MTAKQRKIIVFSTLPAAIIWAFFNIGDKRRTADPSATAPVTIQPIAAEGIKAASTVPLDKDKLAHLRDADWGEDPFRHKPLVASSVVAYQAPPEGLRLNGILYNDKNPVAIINGSMVKVGQSIEGARVKEINRENVVLDKDGNEKTLRISRG